MGSYGVSVPSTELLSAIAALVLRELLAALERHERRRGRVRTRSYDRRRKRGRKG